MPLQSDWSPSCDHGLDGYVSYCENNDDDNLGRLYCNTLSTRVMTPSILGSMKSTGSICERSTTAAADKHPQYCAEALGVALRSIPTEGKNMEDLEVAVKKVCARHGVKIARDSSKKEKGDGGRLVMVSWKCVHGMRNRQGDQRGKSPGAHQMSRKRSSQRTGCAFKFTARWPLRCAVNRHPRLTTMQLEHLHEVDTTAMDVEAQMEAPLSSEMQAEAAKLADAGVAPSVQAKVLTALHDRRVETKDIQKAASHQSGGKPQYDAQELLEKVQECTKAGGVYKVKFDTTGRFLHVFWMTAEQVSLATRYGTVLLYDDTAARKQYRLPLGLGIVIDGDFYTRVIFQATTADSTSETLQWLLEVFVEARGAAPDVFIQAPDVALDAAAQKVFPFAIKRRCIWHLMQIVKKDLGEVLGDTFPAFRDTFYKVRGLPTKSRFDEEFTKLLAAYPHCEEYMKVLYDDRERWAEAFSPLAFCVSSWTTDRIEEMISQVRRFCNAKTTLTRVFRFLEDPIETPIGRGMLRNAQLQAPEVSPVVSPQQSATELPRTTTDLPRSAPIPPQTAPIPPRAAAILPRTASIPPQIAADLLQTTTSPPRTAPTPPRIVRIPPRTAKSWFGDELTKPLLFGLRTWPLRFMEEEMDAASVLCSSGLGNSLVGGLNLEKLLRKMDYLGDMIVDVESVACIVEARGGVEMEHVVLAMKGGSHLCSCRTLQTLGLCCRHFWMAMRLSPDFRFHVGILHKHWLAEQAWIPMCDWPTAHRPKWSVALNHDRLDEAEAERAFSLHHQRQGVGGEAAALPHERSGAASTEALRPSQMKWNAGAGEVTLNQMRSDIVTGGAVTPNQLRSGVARREAAAPNQQRSDGAGGGATAPPNNTRSNTVTGGGGGIGVGPTEQSREGGDRWKAIAEGASIGSTLARLAEEGPTVLDRRKLYVDMLRQITAVVERCGDTVDPQAMRRVMATLKSQVDETATAKRIAHVGQAGVGKHAAGVAQAADTCQAMRVDQTAGVNLAAGLDQAAAIGQAATVGQAPAVGLTVQNGARSGVVVGAPEATRLPVGCQLKKRRRSSEGERQR